MAPRSGVGGGWHRFAVLPLIAVTLSSVVVVGSRASAADGCPWMDASMPAEARAQALLAAMNLDQKIEMLYQHQFWQWGAAGYVPGNSDLCIPDLLINDGPAGVGDLQPGTTAFPAPISLASSWDPELQNEFGRAIGWEAWHKGDNVWLGPGVNIARVPMNGRNFEYYGEDPYLAGQTATAVIKGVQENHVIATVKHYAANNQEIDRNTASSNVDERTLHEIYLPAFEAAVKQGHVGSVMCSYNKINGIYACEQPTLLTDYLKKEFGFDGFVMSDWGGTHSTVDAANAGLDMEMDLSKGHYFSDALKEAVQSGEVPMSRLDDMVVRILREMFLVGLFDHPTPPQPQAYLSVVSTPEHVLLARRLAEEGAVLLKNTGDVLPLDDPGQTIAVIGQAGGPHGTMMAYGGGGSSHIPEFGWYPHSVSPLQGIEQTALANGDRVVYADGTAVADAVAAASAADVAVVFANDVSTEGSDRPDLSLTGGGCAFACARYPFTWDQLIASVADANPNTVVVLNTAGPVLMPWVDKVKGVLEAWYPGQEDGNAVAAVLYGEVNPSGKLPQTFPAKMEDLPTRTKEQYPGVDGNVSYSEGLQVGYRWFDAQGIEPLFPFGHGLSYTTFAYSGLKVRRARQGTAVSFTVTNTGERAGAEVAQVYVSFPNVAGEPPRQLKAYRRVFLPAGESTQVTAVLGQRAFSYWDSGRHAWAVAPGRYGILVGSSSRDIRLQSDVMRRS